ncbi:YTH domain-containing protein ECT1 isoform X2 [Argentina anserina]|uniref:YTH domain-containing protein ECT1 isoform X2 n=1 Tax=Argentina anserina TaxID=57926 RepID=UPI002176317D|nr:YTH domain-containing protein ECT1 isoform X2 [Potentilla anserina]
MAANQPQGADRTSEEKPAEPDTMKEQDAGPIGHPREAAAQPGSFNVAGDPSVFPANVYSPQGQQTFYYRGYENGTGEWEEYPPYLNSEGLEITSPGVYNENHPSLVYHSGYSYNPQMPYGPYSPVTTPMPSGGRDGQLYSPQQFPFSGPPYYQQLGPHSMPYITSPTPGSQPDLTTLVGIDQPGDSMLFGPRPSYSPVGSYGRGNFPGNPGSFGYHDMHQGFDGLRSGGLWSDWSKPSDRQRSYTPFSPSVSPQPIGSVGSYGQNVGMGSQHQRSMYGYGSGSNSYNRGYISNGFNQGSSLGSASFSSFGANNRGFMSLETSKRHVRGTSPICSCNAPLDILCEQNRGPRASKPKAQLIADNSVENTKLNTPTTKVHDETYNQPDFVTDYKDAKFFIIKSYSEDNVHKSIKYGVWASTPNGNRKLDAAYHEATEKQESCPIFLLFSVNASAQFCGVAEMIGPVDFDKSVDYWQQDKWSGQFPVKWHAIKDVPNSQFRHIVLENNDNKPVTNSRDTQEVKLEQGIEMLNIFKNYETEMSILDDFDFYEDRQKAMQERKARQQASLITSVVGENEHRNAVQIPTDFIKHMSKSFAQVVRLDEGTKEAVSDGPIGSRVKLEDAIPVSVSSAQIS